MHEAGKAQRGPENLTASFPETAVYQEHEKTPCIGSSYQRAIGKDRQEEKQRLSALPDGKIMSSAKTSLTKSRDQQNDDGCHA
jgi:hypothetical protein